MQEMMDCIKKVQSKTDTLNEERQLLRTPHWPIHIIQHTKKIK